MKTIEDLKNDNGEIDLTKEPKADEVIQSTDQITELIKPEVDVQEPTKPVQKTTEEVTPQSSLTPEIQEPVTPVVEAAPVEPVFDEKAMYKYLSEKQGKEITSLDDLIPAPVEIAVSPLEEDPQLKEIYEWRQRTGRPVSDWINFQKDYDGMSNINVAREILQLRYPDLTPEELSYEMSNFTVKEEDLDEDKIRKGLNLKKFAVDGRKELNALRSEFDTSVAPTTSISQEQQEKIKFFDSYQEQTKQNKFQAEDYNLQVATQVKALESIPLTLSDDLSINFVAPAEGKDTLQDFMQMKHWYKEDGGLMHSEVVKDSFFLQNKDAIIKLAFEQGIAKGKEDLDKTSRNITLETRPTMEGAAGDTNEIIVEDGVIASTLGQKIRFGGNK